MLAIIKDVPRMAGRDLLFGQRASGFTGWSRGKAALDARSRVKNWTTHDIRRSVATRMADLGIAPHVIEQILNHQSGHKRGSLASTIVRLQARGAHRAGAVGRPLRTLVEGGERKIISTAARGLLRPRQPWYKPTPSERVGHPPGHQSAHSR